MNLERIVERFAQLSGLSPQEAAPWQGLCGEAMSELNALTLPGADAPQAAETLNAAAAALVLYRYSAALACGPESGFSAGEVRVTKSGAGVQAARILWEQTRRAAAPYLRDESFFFGQVRA